MTGIFNKVSKSPIGSLYRGIDTNDPIVNRIHSFLQLQEGWHYGEGRNATQEAIDLALDINSLLLEYGADEIEVFPDTDGGILVSGYHEDHMIEILCSPQGSIAMLHEIDGEIIRECNDIYPDEISAYLGRVAWKPKKSYV